MTLIDRQPFSVCTWKDLLLFVFFYFCLVLHLCLIPTPWGNPLMVHRRYCCQLLDKVTSIPQTESQLVAKLNEAAKLVKESCETSNIIKGQQCFGLVNWMTLIGLCWQRYQYISTNLELEYFKILKLDGTFGLGLYLLGSGASRSISGEATGLYGTLSQALNPWELV